MAEKQVVKSEEFELDIVSVQSMVKEYQTLTLVPDDSKSYKVCRTALTACIRVRTGIDKRRLELNAKGQKKIKDRNSMAKELASLVAPAEDHLSALVKGEDARKAEIEAEKEAAEKKKNQDRVDALLKVGVTMDFFDAASMEDADFAKTLDDATIAYNAEQERLAAEKKAKVEKEAAEKAEREAETKRLAKQKAAQDAEADRLKKIADDLKAAQDKIDADRKASRIQALKNIGVHHEDELIMWWEGEKLKEVNFVALEDDNFNSLVGELSDKIKYLKGKAAKEKLRAEEQLEAEAKVKAEKDAKEATDRAAQEKVWAEEEAQRKADLLPDKEKVKAWVQANLEMPIPELTDEGAKEVLRIAVEHIDSILHGVEKEIEGL